MATKVDAALLEACDAALAWVDALERDDDDTDFDRLYWHWVELMRAAVANARNTAWEAPRASDL
jgi:hypothetical protein